MSDSLGCQGEAASGLLTVPIRQQGVPALQLGVTTHARQASMQAGFAVPSHICTWVQKYRQPTACGVTQKHSQYGRTESLGGFANRGTFLELGGNSCDQYSVFGIIIQVSAAPSHLNDPSASCSD